MHLYGRSSSHFTRIARIFAAELEVDVEFNPIRDLMSADPDDYGGHPALKMPTLITDAISSSEKCCRSSPTLRAFAQRFGARTSARATAYAFDFPAT